MFTPQERTRLRDALVARARADERVTGAALTGSASRDAEDRWSDIDLALGVAAGADFGRVMADWTAAMYRQHGALDHLDVRSGAATYRVFLLASTLQVDIAFAPEDDFGPTAPTFRLLFGRVGDRVPAAAAGRGAELIGMAWLYALHARSSLARGRVWQAEYMISGVRDHVLALACVRHGVPAVQGRGMDQLPAAVTAGFTAALARSVDEFLAAGPAPGSGEIDAAFWQACNGGQRRMAEYLLDQGADINAIPGYAGQQTAAEAAGSVGTQRQALVDWLKERGAAGD